MNKTEGVKREERLLLELEKLQLQTQSILGGIYVPLDLLHENSKKIAELIVEVRKEVQED